MAILNLLSEEPQGLTISQISRRLEIARSSIHGLVYTLLRSGYLNLDGSEQKRFRLGVRLIQLGLNVADSLDLRSVARPHLEQLVASTHETAFLAVPHDGELVYVDKVVSEVRDFRTDLRLGARRPLHCSSLGKALLASLDDASAERLIERVGLQPATRFSITDRSVLFQDLALTRRRGYSMDLHEAVIGICCVGAPIRDHLERPVASISIATIDHLFKPEEFGVAVRETAIAISRSLGWIGDSATLYEPVPGSVGALLGPVEREES